MWSSAWSTLPSRMSRSIRLLTLAQTKCKNGTKYDDYDYYNPNNCVVVYVRLLWDAFIINADLRLTFLLHVTIVAVHLPCLTCWRSCAIAQWAAPCSTLIVWVARCHALLEVRADLVDATTRKTLKLVVAKVIGLFLTVVANWAGNAFIFGTTVGWNMAVGVCFASLPNVTRIIVRLLLEVGQVKLWALLWLKEGVAVGHKQSQW